MKPVHVKSSSHSYGNFKKLNLNTIAYLGFLLLFYLLSVPSYGQRIGAKIDESGIQVTYHVKTNGNNSNSGTSADKPLRSLSKAIDKAKNGPLNEGKKTKILCHEGKYVTTNMWHVEWTTKARATILIIEGTEAGKVILEGAGTSEVLSIKQKDNLVLRNLTFTNGNGNSSLWIGAYHPFDNPRQHDVLIEYCDFKDSQTSGARLHGIDNLTIKDCKFVNNDQTGLSYIGRYGKFINVTITNNGFTDDGYNGFDFAGSHSQFDNINISNNKLFGFRMDHVAEHVTIKRSVFKKNGRSGMIFETCVGPVLIEDCEIAENKEKGIMLITAHDVTINRCKVVNNKLTQLGLNPQDRSEFVQPNGYTAGDLQQPAWMGKKPIQWNENTTITNSAFSVTNGDNNAYLIKRDDQTNHSQYKRWFEEELTAVNNAYCHSSKTDVFDVSTLYSTREYTDFAGWKAATGEEDNSVWLNDCVSFSGYYKIVAKHSQKVLDVSGSSTANSVVVHQWNWTGNDNQQWKLDILGGGYYKIVAKHSGKVLHVPGTANGTDVQQYVVNGSAGQAWRLESVGGGYYKIIGKGSNKVLEVSESSSSKGAVIQINSWTGNDNQKWKLESISSSSRIGTEEVAAESEASQLLVYPNPARGGDLTLVLPAAATDIKVVVTDLLGREQIRRVYKPASGRDQIQLPTAGMSNGVYLFSVWVNHKKITRRVTILQK